MQVQASTATPYSHDKCTSFDKFSFQARALIPMRYIILATLISFVHDILNLSGLTKLAMTNSRTVLSPASCHTATK